ncbi:nucleotidyl transferase AbiEii/AbiGii toxin family protein [Marinobacterium sp. AK62]|uniref:Nucleotidyl transferase AbiEii/AbiGii toxin family protein n=1 Tax=Marinobacterium alkalitolerans TaxID=1542925 RepID=A0ABS3ZDS5_9GAMM|nr:nucleotidyl transferase AbiEii/AbiGii toxin family protein [Marinobacterium alkalitolerans]MBP0049851.1 nucleotidyl transferase AbiEii/AbiGii toxin family protein [Marinobacterium alkalitolerans]
MAFEDRYRKQVELLVRTLPHVAEEECFALKGGTAINLFIRDMPRLSVDIDLTWLPQGDRGEALSGIDAALKRIADRLRKSDDRISINATAPKGHSKINKLVVRTPDRVQIKIEVTPVLRGCVYDPVMTMISEKAEDEFGFAEINVLSFADLYAGKIMAALDRQHPRDLFDVNQLLENEGLTDELRTALIIYLISHDHSPQSLLVPTEKDIAQEYEQNFRGMTEDEVLLETLVAARATLAAGVVSGMPEDHKQFLISFYRRSPEWERLGQDGLDKLPAVKWRELNLDKAGEDTREAIIAELEKILWP